jgi:hypothetical protein
MKHGKDFYSWLHQVSQINERLYEDAALISRLLDQCSVRLDDLKLMGFSDIDFGEDEWLDLRSRVDRIKSQWGRVVVRVYNATEKHKCRQHRKSNMDKASFH